MRSWRNLRYRIFSFEVKCADIISRSLVGGKGKYAVKKQLRKALVDFRSTVRITDSEANGLWLNCMHMLSRISWKRDDNSKIYAQIKRLLPSLESFKNRFVLDIEMREKNAYLRDLMSDGIFYLCSWHKDCAADHKDYQGKIYVSEDWEERCLDGDQGKIRAYIKNHNCITVQEVIGDPVYMITRPNCRHYFISVSVDEVLHSSVKKLLKQHDLVKEGHVKNDSYYAYREYYERVKLLITLRNTCPCEELEADIRKTRKLMKKWLSRV